MEVEQQNPLYTVNFNYGYLDYLPNRVGVCLLIAIGLFLCLVHVPDTAAYVALQGITILKTQGILSVILLRCFGFIFISIGLWSGGQKAVETFIIDREQSEVILKGKRYLMIVPFEDHYPCKLVKGIVMQNELVYLELQSGKRELLLMASPEWGEKFNEQVRKIIDNC